VDNECAHGHVPVHPARHSISIGLGSMLNT
jgi:hypothetical protein